MQTMTPLDPPTNSGSNDYRRGSRQTGGVTPSVGLALELSGAGRAADYSVLVNSSSHGSKGAKDAAGNEINDSHELTPKPPAFNLAQ